MIDRVAQRSGDLFDSGLFCAESVLLAIAEAKGIQSDLVPRIATGLCSGMARTSGPCGAVSGAIMALNLFTGRSSPDESVEENYALVRKLIGEFEAEFGSTTCGELIGCDLSTEEGRSAYEANNLDERCRRYVEQATSVAMTLLES